jgi:hypothetical protein
MSKPFASDQVAFDRDRTLLILAGEQKTADLGFNPLQGRSAFALWMEQIAGLARVGQAMAQRDRLLLHRDGRQVENGRCSAGGYHIDRVEVRWRHVRPGSQRGIPKFDASRAVKI